jgi:glycosyltransferase involved in cell wall biosynthesis
MKPSPPEQRAFGAARILVLLGNIPLLGNERANIETIHQLCQQGAEVKFLIRREWTEDSIQKELRRRNLPFDFVPYFAAIRYGAGLRAWIKNIYGILGGSAALLAHIRSFRPTHLHVGSTEWVLNFLPALVISNIPLVFRAGEMPSRHHAIWRWVWRYACRRSAAIVCDSRFLRAEVEAIGAPKERCEVIYAPPPTRESPMLRYARKPPHPLVVLYIGQVSADKGVDLLIEAAEKLVNQAPIRFLIAGDLSWNNPLGQSLAARIRERGLDDQIVFLGFVNDIEPLYISAHLHVAPSICQEGYGLTVVEAKAHGVPSIVFPSGALSELVEHGREGLVCESPSAGSLESAIRYYLENPLQLDEHGSAAYRSLSERLRVQDYGIRWAGIYAVSPPVRRN